MQLWDFLDNVGKGISLYFRNLRPRRRWFVFIAVILTLVVCLLATENFTAVSYYYNLGKKISLLKELSLISEHIQPGSELYPVYKQTIDDLGKRTISPLVITLPMFRPNGQTLLIGLGKFFSGASIGLLLWFAYLLGLYAGDGSKRYTLGLYIWTVTAGLISLALPIVYQPWVNFLGVPLLQVIFFYVYGLYSAKREGDSRIETTDGSTSSEPAEYVFFPDYRQRVQYDIDSSENNLSAKEDEPGYSLLRDTALVSREVEFLRQLFADQFSAIETLANNEQVLITEHVVTDENEVSSIISDVQKRLVEWLRTEEAEDLVGSDQIAVRA